MQPHYLYGKYGVATIVAKTAAVAVAGATEGKNIRYTTQHLNMSPRTKKTPMC